MITSIQLYSRKSLFPLLVLFYFFSSSTFAQISEGGTPYSFLNLQVGQDFQAVNMPEINVPQLLEEDAVEQSKGVPFRFGYGHSVKLNLSNSGTWQYVDNGRLWRLKIHARGATSINLIFGSFFIPEGGKLFIYGLDGKHVIGALTARNNNEDNVLGTGIIPRDEIILEYFEPSAVSGLGRLQVESVIQGYKDVFKDYPFWEDYGGSGSCNNNVNCPEGEPWQNEIRSAAMILTAGNTRLCSGAMINNVRQDLTPYFLTANHCMSGTPNTWVIMFNYQSPTCVNQDGPLNYTVSGTTTMAKNSSSDFALLKLNTAPPDSYQVHFAGWTRVNAPSTSSVGIHHPDGDIKKISFDYEPCVSSDYTPSPYLPNSHWEITAWNDGTTEPGSSGSPLFDQNHRIIGQLHGGWASCTSITQDYYGKFSMSWDYGTTPATRLKDWLDPDNTGALFVDGWDPSIGDPDTVPPTRITDLAVVNPTSNSVTLNWTSPMDTSYGGVKQYQVRMASAPITDPAAFANATPVTGVGTPKPAGTPEVLVVSNLTHATNYYFAIVSRDQWNNYSLVSNSPMGTTLGAPQISVTPTSLHHILTSNQVIVDTIRVSNISGHASTLDYSVEMINNTFPGKSVDIKIIPVNNTTESGIENKDNPRQEQGQSIEGFGGPDAWGYKWIDSDEANGPVYVWNDISSTGTAVTTWTPTGTFGGTDEGYAGPFNLGFNFKFYGQTKSQIYISSNGFLCFAPLTANTYTNAAIPSTAVPNEIICPFWDDLDAKAPGTIHYKQEGNTFIIQWTNYQRYSGTASYTWQVVLYSGGKIMVYYNNMTGTLNSATVGVENAAGTVGLQVAKDANYVKNNLALKIAAEPDWLTGTNMNGQLYNGNTALVELTFRAEDFTGGNYSMDVKVTSNDPANQTVTVPVTMYLEPIPVEMTSFTAETIRDEVMLKWETSTETNNMGFKVEKKKTGSVDWTEAGYVEGKGNTTEKQSYSFREKGLGVGKYTYRLIQTDFDGAKNYSKEIEVDVTNPREYALYQNYPNPFNPTTVISYSLPEKSEITIRIYNSLGEYIGVIEQGTKEAGYYRIDFDGKQLTSGTYIYQLRATSENNTFTDTKKMLFIK